ncbi:allatostatins [Orussus abietinus]|uniref:allatostatins n=1 Tax=Orussus abietinus TaxID=222816 RepID=UPI000626D5DB|nr:allatostatins [Orussus abietinus]
MTIARATGKSLVACCALVLLGGSSLASENDHASTHPLLDGATRGAPEKRAYTYVSEYKRLPVYNFGLGKRWGAPATVDGTDDKRMRTFSFGLGKRAQPYSFGLGKRGNLGYNPMRMNLDYPLDYGYENFVEDEALEDLLPDKRSGRLYSFGLGKRVSGLGPREVLGTGKQSGSDFAQRYLMGSGKRIAEEEEVVA